METARANLHLHEKTCWTHSRKPYKRTIGFQAWRTPFNNFTGEVASLEGSHIGVIQAVREFPGILALALLAIFVMMIIEEHRLLALSVVLSGLGLTATGWSPSYFGLLLTPMTFRFGFHYCFTTYQSLTL